MAHFYSALQGPEEWNFVVPGEKFLVVDTVDTPETSWGSCMALMDDGIVVVLSYPSLHGFSIS